MNSPPNFEENKTVEVTDIHENTSQEIIRITSDRAKLILVEYKDSFEKKREWHTPLSLVTTLVLVFITSTFREAWGFAAETWSAFFLFALAVSFLWLIRSCYIAFKSKTIKDIVERMKRNS